MTTSHAVRTRTRVLAAAALVICVTGYAAAAVSTGSAREDANSVARVGHVAPELRVRLEDGSDARLSSLLQGRRTVVVFHSPECGVCVLTLPALEPFPASLQRFMVDVSGNLAATGRIPATGPRYLAADRPIVQRLFPFSGLPTIVFVDESGVIRAGLAGSQPPGRIQKELLAFANGDASGAP